MTTEKSETAHSRSAVDVYAHWTPSTVARAMRERSAIPRIARSAGQEIYQSIYEQRPFTKSETSLQARIALMDGCGIRTQILSLPGLFGINCFPPSESPPLLRTFNDGAAAACRAFPARFLALAVLPHPDMAQACGELRRALDFDLRGTILLRTAFASLASAERFCPPLAGADEAARIYSFTPARPPHLPRRRQEATRTMRRGCAISSSPLNPACAM